jgi:hypothetical protein
MYHNARNDIIESDDITDILGIHVTEENGSKVATIKVCLDPRKDFLAVKDFFLHLANGINQPRLVGPVTAVDSPADLPTVPVPVAETAPTTEPLNAPSEASPEATQPLVESPASSEATPTDTTTAVDGEDTVKVPTSDVVTGSNKKGN